MSKQSDYIRRVVCAALLYPDNVLIIGPRHFDKTMHSLIYRLPESIREQNPEQGFIDQHGVYMDRFEALSVAVAAKQLIRKTTPEDRLFSEDLY